MAQMAFSHNKSQADMYKRGRQSGPQETGTRQPTQRPINGTSGQTQYASTQGTKTIRCLVTRDDTNDESANEEREINIIDGDPKNIYEEAMATEN